MLDLKEQKLILKFLSPDKVFKNKIFLAAIKDSRNLKETISLLNQGQRQQIERNLFNLEKNSIFFILDSCFDWDDRVFIKLLYGDLLLTCYLSRFENYETISYDIFQEI